MFVVFLPTVMDICTGIRTSWHGLSPEGSSIQYSEGNTTHVWAGPPFQDLRLPWIMVFSCKCNRVLVSYGKDSGGQPLKNIHCKHKVFVVSNFYTHLHVFYFHFLEMLMSLKYQRSEAVQNALFWRTCIWSISWWSKHFAMMQIMVCRCPLCVLLSKSSCIFLTHELSSLILILLILRPFLCQVRMNAPCAPRYHWPIFPKPRPPYIWTQECCISLQSSKRSHWFQLFMSS